MTQSLSKAEQPTGGIGTNAGDPNYRAFVGPPDKYDVMGGHQFELLYQLGLREHHRLLDIGCGSLRAGRLFLFYLSPGNYFGIEPNSEVLSSGINQNVGEEAVVLRQAHFSNSPDFAAKQFGVTFQFILAQSIFSHTSADQIRKCLQNVTSCLDSDGLFAATFMLGASDYSGSEWVYPGCVTYTDVSVRRFADEAGLAAARLDAAHPNRQTWYLFGKNADTVSQWEGDSIGLAATNRLKRLARRRWFVALKKLQQGFRNRA